MENNKKGTGFFILAGICAVMIAVTVPQILLFRGSGSPGDISAARALAFRASLINALLGAAGMGALLYLGNKTRKRLKSLEDIVRPIEEGNYKALVSFGKEVPSAGDKKEQYAQLKKAAGDLGKFVEVFRAHAAGISAANARLEEFLGAAAGFGAEPPRAGTQTEINLGAHFLEIESSSEQAISALEQADNYLAILNETSGEQGQAITEVDSRLAETAELTLALAGLLEESGKKAGELRETINSGEEESKNTFDIIKDASKNLEKITEMAQVINQISEQTNMLSMNAAIESAHAGSAGAGFAVVSEEIRKLADLTKENAGSIQDTLRAITAQINDALKASKISSETFGVITAKIAGFSETLAAAGEDARKSSDTGMEIKTVLEGTLAAAEKIRNSSADIAAFSQSFRAAVESIQSVSGAARSEAEKSGGGFELSGLTLKKALDEVRDLLNETEELEGMIFPDKDAAAGAGSLAGGLSSGAAYRPAANSSGSEASGNNPSPAAATGGGRSSAPGRDPKEESAPSAADDGKPADAKLEVKLINKEGAAELQLKETDNSWRRDITVKSPPRTVR